MMEIKTSEHVFISGTTGCGKTMLAEIYLAGYESVIKLDTKGEYLERIKDGKEIWYGLERDRDFEIVTRLEDLFNSSFGRVIYAPEWEENNVETYDKVFEFVYKNGDTIIWIDELMTVTENALRIPRYLKAIFTAGRSRRAAAWALTQRPSGIPQIIPANCKHFFIFSLPLSADRKKMVELTGAEKILIPPEKFHFWYYQEGMFNDEVAKATLDIN